MTSVATRRLFGVLLFAVAMVPIVGALDLLADRRVVTALLGLLAGGLLAAGAARLMFGGRAAAREADRGE
ncbi:MAG: hypothetical protein JXB32_01665 [Deltaproteobacteria bacterium]|nr:hypothetical protein [Deltaproteobacteria bacterium]